MPEPWEAFKWVVGVIILIVVIIIVYKLGVLLINEL